jgi:hypothetical protein
MDKKTNVEDAARAAALCKKAGIEVVVFWVSGQFLLSKEKVKKPPGKNKALSLNCFLR